MIQGCLAFLNLSLENILLKSNSVKVGGQISSISVLSYTGSCTLLSHHNDPGFNEEWRWKGRGKKSMHFPHQQLVCILPGLMSNVG